MTGRVLLKIVYLLVRRIFGLAAPLFRRDMEGYAKPLLLLANGSLSGMSR